MSQKLDRTPKASVREFSVRHGASQPWFPRVDADARGAERCGRSNFAPLWNSAAFRRTRAAFRLTRAACGFGVAALLLGSPSHAAVNWSSGFESNNTNEWDYELNPEGLSIVTDPVAAGQYALRAELTSETVWSNGIFRTELQYKPADSKTAEGKETYFGWSLYLPAPLPAGDYQLGYFETRSTYNQVFSLHAEGADLSLVLNHDAAKSKHAVPSVLTAGVWHRVVFHVKWSADKAVGAVSVWWDGTKVVDQAKAQTFVDDDPALIQLGLLKNPPAPPQAIVLFVDEAIDGQSYADVSLGIPEMVPNVDPIDTAPVATDSGAVVPASTAPASTGSTTTSALSTDPTTAPATSAPGAASSDTKSNCSFVVRRTPSGGNTGAKAWGLAAVGAVLAFASRKRGRQSGH